jgi:hypothetical protein
MKATFVNLEDECPDLRIEPETPEEHKLMADFVNGIETKGISVKNIGHSCQSDTNLLIISMLIGAIE